MNPSKDSGFPPWFPKHTALHNHRRTTAQAEQRLNLGAQPDTRAPGVFNGAGDSSPGARTQDPNRDSHEGIADLNCSEVTRSSKAGKAKGMLVGSQGRGTRAMVSGSAKGLAGGTHMNPNNPSRGDPTKDELKVRGDSKIIVRP